MYIKKFVGENLDQIQQEINSELGPNAVVLTTRTLEAGFLQSFFFNDEFEVTVGVDPQDLKEYQEGDVLPADKRRLQGMAAMHRLKPIGFEAEDPKVLQIPVTGPLKFNPRKQNLIALVGNKNVGKTATLTKLALKLQRSTPYKVALTSTGNMPKERAEELRGLAKMFKLEHRELRTADSLRHTMNELKQHEIFLVDTPGNYDVVEVATFLNVTPEHQVLLVLSATDPIAEQVKAVEKYSTLNPKGLIITKLNENPDLIMLAQLAMKHNIPFAFLSEGSNLSEANADDLEVRVINEKLRINQL